MEGRRLLRANAIHSIESIGRRITPYASAAHRRGTSFPQRFQRFIRSLSIGDARAAQALLFANGVAIFARREVRSKGRCSGSVSTFIADIKRTPTRRFDPMNWQLLAKRALFLAIVLLAVALPASAQSQNGSLYGSTVGPEGQPMPGVTVTLTGPGTSLVQASDASGKFRFPRLSPGTYIAQTQLEGFATTRREGIEINVGRNTEVELRLQISDVINIVAEAAPLLDSRQVAKSQTVTLQELERIPSARDPWAVLQSTPGVLTDRINVGGNESGQQALYVGPGSCGCQAVWSLDGMVITDMSAVGSSPGYYDFDSFEEMQVTTGGSDASLSTGGVVLNMVTKKGTNEWRGSGRYYLTDDSAQADLKFDSSDLGQAGAWNNNHAQTSFKQGNRIVKIEDLGLEIGGPLLKDRLWVWGSYAKPKIHLKTISDFDDKST